MRLTDLRDRDVVNVNDGKRLGVISDVELDVEQGTVKAIIIPGAGGLRGVLGKKNELLIPWDKIIKVGLDTILVDFPVDEESL